MKKTLLLSVVASTLIMAGGDIEPVAAPVVETSNWEWSGTAKVYYQTMDHQNYWLEGNGVVGTGDKGFFHKNNSAADAGIQLRVSNKDVIAGFGFGAEVTGLSTLGLVNAGVVTASMMSAGLSIPEPGSFEGMADDALSSAYISQAYLTYGFGNTSIKVGRQELPMSLSPFAYSEGWNIFKNTFEAALIVNTDIQDTVIVGAYVNRANGTQSLAGSIVAITATTGHDLSNWASVGENGTYMLTAQNKSIANLTLTGSFYYAPSFDKASDMDVTVFWADAKYNNADFPVTFAAQGGVLDYDATAATDTQTTAFGARIGGKVGPVALSAAYTSVDMEANSISVTNFGTGVKSPLYTQQVLNQVFIDGHNGDADTWQVKGVYKGLGGKLVAQYANSNTANDWDYGEFDFIYATKFNTAYGDIGAKAMWINQDFDGALKAGPGEDDTNNVIRLIASYDF